MSEVRAVPAVVVELNPHVREFINLQAHRIRHFAGETARNVAMIGEALFEVKKKLAHGQWLAWLDAEFRWSDRHARNCIAVYEWLKGKSEKFSNLPIDVSALYLLARPSTPTEARDKALEMARAGTTVTHQKAAEIVRAAPALLQRRTPEQITADKRGTALNSARFNFVNATEELAGITFSTSEVFEEFLEYEELYSDDRDDSGTAEAAAQLEVAIAFLLEMRTMFRKHGLLKPAKFGAPRPVALPATSSSR